MLSLIVKGKSTVRNRAKKKKQNKKWNLINFYYNIAQTHKRRTVKESNIMKCEEGSRRERLMCCVLPLVWK